MGRHVKRRDMGRAWDVGKQLQVIFIYIKVNDKASKACLLPIANVNTLAAAAYKRERDNITQRWTPPVELFQ